MRRLAHLLRLTFLDSAARDASLGRYSYLACDPFSTYGAADGRASCDGRILNAIPGVRHAHSCASMATPSSRSPTVSWVTLRRGPPCERAVRAKT
ncbi:MAG: hypothetical protein ABSF67_24280 [Roseiarcus sp.]